MVEIALRSLFESASRTISDGWNAAQRSIEEGRLLEESEEHYMKGCLLVWQKLLTRLCDGCWAKDSENTFHQWLGHYRTKLLEAASSEQGQGNPYVRGQVDSFNSFLRSLSGANKTLGASYKKKVEEVMQKQKELLALQEELESIFWDSLPEAENEMPIV